MAYTITACTLLGMINDTTPAYSMAWNLQAETGELAFGEYMRLRATVTSTSTPFSVGQRFVFNPCLFGAVAFGAPLVVGAGWVIDIANYTGTGVFNTYLALGNVAAETTQANSKLVVTRISGTVMQVDLFFYAAQDNFGYLSSIPRSNRQTLQAAALLQDVLDNVAVSAYRRPVSYLEFLMYEADANLQPSTVTYSDAYVRNALTINQKQNSYAVSCKFVDNTIGAGAAWAGASLNCNSLTAVLNEIGTVKFANFNRKPNPYLSNKVDTNFDEDENQLVIGENNQVTLTINTATQTPDKVVLRLWRTDDANLSNVQPFAIEYDIKTADVPLSDATAFPNPIDTDAVFSTPAAYTVANPSVIEFSIDGNYLSADAQYRIWIGIYDSAARFVSSHLTRALRAGSSRAVGFTITGNTQTLDYQYPNSNDVTLSQYERFRSLVTLEGATYAAPLGVVDFLSQLVEVSAEVNDGTNILGRAQYDFQANRSISTPEMLLSVSGTNYTFAFDFRAPSDAAVPVAMPLTVVFIATFRVPLANGSFDTVSYLFNQTIRRYAENTVRIAGLRFLDYAAFQLSTIRPIDTFCDDTNLYIVETELDAVPPDATLQALVMYGTPTQTEAIFEEEANAGIYLPQFTAPQISNVSPTFGVDKLAYFVLDISRFPSNAIATSIGVVVVDF